MNSLMQSIIPQGQYRLWHKTWALISFAPILTPPYRYSDDQYEYRHVQLPKAMLKVIPKEYHDPQTGTLKLLWEEEWRALGITQVRRDQLDLERQN